MATIKQTLTANKTAKKAKVAKATKKVATKTVATTSTVHSTSGLKLKGTSVIAKETKKAYGKTQSCGDDIAKALTAKINAAKDKGKEFASICSANGIDAGRWEHLNFGMQRMNLGNKLRAIAKSGHALVI